MACRVCENYQVFGGKRGTEYRASCVHFSHPSEATAVCISKFAKFSLSFYM